MYKGSSLFKKDLNHFNKNYKIFAFNYYLSKIKNYN